MQISIRSPGLTPASARPTIFVKAVAADQPVPPHPVDGALPPEGGPWGYDAYTCRLLVDGVIRTVEPEPEPPADPDPEQQHPEIPILEAR